ncbi:DUF397 domain-containing protein [Streptomyces sp. NPDC003016]
MSSSTWQKSSFSPDGSNCLEIRAAGTGAVQLRGSDDPGHPDRHHPRTAPPRARPQKRELQLPLHQRSPRARPIASPTTRAVRQPDSPSQDFGPYVT